MKLDLNLSVVNSFNSSHSLFSSNQSMTDLAALFTIKGWINPAQEILMTESIAQEKQHRLTKAFEHYVEQPNAHLGHELIAQLQEAKADLTAEYDYAKKQQAFYTAQAEQEAQSRGSFLAAWTQWIWHGVQDFFGSSSKALAEKYAQIALYRRSQLEELSSLLTTLQQARWEEMTIKIDDKNEEEIIAIDTSKIKASQRKLLQQKPFSTVSVKNSIPNQLINLGQLYTYSLDNVFSSGYTLLGATEIGQFGLPDWLSLQYKKLGSYPTGSAQDIVVSGNVVFVADDSAGLLILDMSVPSTPRLLGNYTTSSGQAQSVAVSGSIVFVAAGPAGLWILDVSAPNNPRLLGNYTAGLGYAYGIAVSGGIVFVADYNAGLLILNVSAPSAPFLLGNYSIGSGNAISIAVSGNTLFVADYIAGLLILNVSIPSEPYLLGNYSALSGQSWDVAISGDTLFVADYNEGVLILNVSTPSMPYLLYRYAGSGQTWGVAVSGNILFVADGPAGLLILDVSSTKTPGLLGSYPALGEAVNVAVSGSTVFIADYIAGLVILDMSQGQLMGNPPDSLGQQFSLTVSARNVTTLLAETVFTLTLDQPPYLIQNSVSDQSVFPRHTLSFQLSSERLFINPGVSFLSLSIRSNSGVVSDWLTLDVIPVLIGRYPVDSGQTSIGIAVLGSTVFVDNWNALLVLDVSIPSSPDLLMRYVIEAGGFSGIAVSGSTLFVADWNLLEILDISEPSNPVLLGNYSKLSGQACGVAVSGNTVFVVDWNALLILNVSTPSSPYLLANYSELSGNALGVAVSGNTLFVGDWDALLILDVSIPSSPRLLQRYPIDLAGVWGVAVSGATVFIGDDNVGLVILDLSTPDVPRLLGSYRYPVAPGQASAVAVSGNTVFVADSTAGLLILDASQWSLTATPNVTAVGNYNLALVATDALGGTASAEFVLRVEGPPQFNRKVPSQYAKVGETFSYFAPLGLVTDPNFDPITFDSTLINGQPLPRWLSFSPISATYAGTPEDGDVGDFTILLTATDNIAGITNTTFNLYVNHVPAVITPLPQSITGRTGRFFAFEIPETTFSDWPDDSILFYNATLQDGSPLPAWLSFNGSTQNRTFLGTPIIGRDEGTLNLIMQATDNLGAYTSAPMQLSLLSNSPPYVTSQIPDQPARIGVLFQFSLSQSEIPFLDIEEDPLTYRAHTPSWMKLEIENQSTIVTPPYWPHWLAYNTAKVNKLTFSGKPSFNDYSDALLFRTARVVIYAYDDFPNSQSRASVAFDIQIQGINQTGISLAAISISMMLVLAVYGAYKKWPALYNCFCKKRYSVNSVTAYIGESFDYNPKKAQPRMQVGDVEEVTVVLPPKPRCCHFFQPYRPLRRGLERPNWMEYDFQSDRLRSKSSLTVAKVDNEDQLIVQLKKENSQIIQQFTLFIDQRPSSPLENDFKNSEAKQNDDVELTPLAITSST